MCVYTSSVASLMLVLCLVLLAAAPVTPMNRRPADMGEASELEEEAEQPNGNAVSAVRAAREARRQSRGQDLSQHEGRHRHINKERLLLLELSMARRREANVGDKPANPAAVRQQVAPNAAGSGPCPGTTSRWSLARKGPHCFCTTGFHCIGPHCSSAYSKHPIHTKVRPVSLRVEDVRIAT